MSSGVGLRPPPPPLFRLQGHGAQRPTHRQRQKGLASPAYRKPSPVAAGRPLGKIKKEASRGRGTFTPGVYRLLRGPHARDRPNRRRQSIQTASAHTRPPAHRRAHAATALATRCFPQMGGDLFVAAASIPGRVERPGPRTNKEGGPCGPPSFFTATELRWIRSAGCTSCTGSDRYRNRHSWRSSSSVPSTSADPCGRTRCSHRRRWWHPTAPSS